MNKNIRLLIGASSFAALAIVGLQGCGSDSDTGTTTPKAGSSGAGAPAGGAPSAGSGGASAGAPAGGASAGSGTAGASAGSGGASAGSGGASAGSGGASAGSGGASGGSGGGAAALTCTTNAPFPAMGETCTTYCNNYDTTCKANVDGWTNDKYADKAACMTDCMNKFGYTGDDVQAAICCRAYHVKNAAMGTGDTLTANKKTHCPHAAGKALCK